MYGIGPSLVCRVLGGIITAGVAACLFSVPAVADILHSDPKVKPGRPMIAVDLPRLPVEWVTQADGAGIWLPQDIASGVKYIDEIPNGQQKFEQFGACLREHHQPLRKEGYPFMDAGYLRDSPNQPLKIGDDEFFDQAYVQLACKAKAFK